MKKSFRINLPTFLLILFGFFSFPFFYTHALTISPPRIELRVDPGETITENLTLTNEKDTTEQFFVSFENFEAQGESGTPFFVEANSGLGTWISSQNVITLGPRESKIIPFTIKVPQNADAGGHFASIFWGTNPNQRGGQVSIGAKVGTLILLSVNGEILEDGGLLSFNTLNKQFFYKTLPVNFEYRFQNDGNDRIKPVGNTIIRNTLFIPTEKINPNPSEGNVLPGSTRRYEFKWIEYERDKDYVSREGAFGKFFENATYQWKNFALGLYSAQLKLEYGQENNKTSKTVFFFVFPWELTVILVLVILISYFGGKKLIRKYNKYIIEKAKINSNL